MELDYPGMNADEDPEIDRLRLKVEVRKKVKEIVYTYINTFSINQEEEQED